MTQPLAQHGAEYIIYTFDKLALGQKHAARWHYHNTLNEITQAMAEAKSLFETESFQRIEIKKRYFDPRKNRTIDQTYKIIEGKQRTSNKSVWLIGLGLFSITLFLYLT